MVAWGTAREAAQVVQPGQRIFVQGACATPTALLEALVNPHMPRTHGDSFVHFSQLTFAVEWDGTVLPVSWLWLCGCCASGTTAAAFLVCTMKVST